MYALTPPIPPIYSDTQPEVVIGLQVILEGSLAFAKLLLIEGQFKGRLLTKVELIVAVIIIIDYYLCIWFRVVI